MTRDKACDYCHKNKNIDYSLLNSKTKLTRMCVQYYMNYINKKLPVMLHSQRTIIFRKPSISLQTCNFFTQVLLYLPIAQLLISQKPDISKNY